jgi:hypothetical protein
MRVRGWVALGAMWMSSPALAEELGVNCKVRMSEAIESVATLADAAAKLSACTRQPSKAEQTAKKVADLQTRYADRSGWAHISDSLKLVAKADYTNADTLLTGPGYVTGVSREFDKERGVGSVSFGWVDRKVVRDLCVASSSSCFEGYARGKVDSDQKEAWTWLVLDAVTANAIISYGTTLDDLEGDDNFKTSNEMSFSVGLKWSVPLDGGSWRNPLD